MNKKKIETSKLLLYINYSVFILLIGMIIFCTLAEIDCTNLTTLTSFVAAEVGAATSIYYTMCKRLNVPKVIKYIYDDLPDDVRAQVDINMMISHFSD